MTPEARRILEVFRSRGLRAGEVVLFTDFGEAIVWEGGFVRDEGVREALVFLRDHRYVDELAAGLQLTRKGEREAHPGDTRPKFGARAYLIGDEIIIKQAVLLGEPAEYVVDELRVRRIHESDDVGIIGAMRDAVAGQL